MPSSKKKSGLGRGLNALVSEAKVEAGNNAADISIPIKLIKPNPNQPRTFFKEDELQELSDSIKEHGVLQPLLVRKIEKGYEIIAGERRYQASKLAGLKEVPAIVRDVDDKEMLSLALIENLQRSDLNPIEEAKGYKQLIDANDMKQEELAQAVSKSRSTISNALRLLDLPEQIQDMLFNGEITAGHARAILSISDEEARVVFAQKIVREGLSVRATEKLAPMFSVANQTKPVKEPTPASYKKAALVLRKALGTNVRVKNLRGKNKIEISFKDEEELNHILEAIVSKSE